MFPGQLSLRLLVDLKLGRGSTGTGRNVTSASCQSKTCGCFEWSVVPFCRVRCRIPPSAAVRVLPDDKTTPTQVRHPSNHEGSPPCGLASRCAERVFLVSRELIAIATVRIVSGSDRAWRC